MRFDYTSKPAHPHKIFTVINDFVNNNISLERQTIPFPSGLTCAEFMNYLETAEPITVQVTFHVKYGKECCAWDCQDFENPDCEIDMNFASLMTCGSQAVRENIISRCPTAKGFSRMTFVLLHEIGHFMTAEEAEEEEEISPDEEFERMLNAMMIANTEIEFERIVQKYHYSKQEEMLATDWAINFLADPDNRKKTKAFEREFFKAWRG